MENNEEYIVLEGNSVKECFTEFLENYYANEDICAYDLLAVTKAPNLTVEESVSLFGEIMYQADGDYLIRGNADEKWAKSAF